MQRKGGESKFNIILECLKLYYNESFEETLWKTKKRKKKEMRRRVRLPFSS